MELTADVTLPDGTTRQVDIDLTVDDVEDAAEIVELCGVEPLARLAGGVWDALAVKALVYLKLKTLFDFSFDDFDLGFGELERFLTEPDLEVEADLPMAPA